MIDEFIALDAVGTLVRNIIQLNCADDFQRRRIAQDEIDVFGEDLVQPSPVFG